MDIENKSIDILAEKIKKEIDDVILNEIYCIQNGWHSVKLSPPHKNAVAINQWLKDSCVTYTEYRHIGNKYYFKNSDHAVWFRLKFL